MTTRTRRDPSSIRVVLCTCPGDDAVGVARGLLEERLVACINIVPGVRSMYWWQGSVQDDEESLLVIKTPQDRYDAMEAKLQELHPYDVPEILGLGADDGSEKYISWVFDETRA